MPKRKKTIRKHTVTATMQFFEFPKAGSSIEFKIFSNKEKIGHIVIGRGSLTWYGRKKQIGRRFSWSRFAEIMDEYANR